MQAQVKMIGDKVFDRKMEQLAEEMRRSVPSLVKQQARSAAQNLGFQTAPYGFDAPEKFLATIEAEVKRVFATRDQPGAVYLLIRQVDPIKAEAYWAAHKKGSRRRALDILNSVTIKKGTDISVLRDARTGRNGHVPKKIQPRALVTQSELNAMVKRQQQLAGFAKAGWYQAARGIGGRVRTNLVDADGKRSTKETFPAYIRKLANSSPGIGGARQGGGENSYWVEIFTNVRHAVDALPKSQEAKAMAAAKEAYTKACMEALKVLRSKIFKRAS